MGLFPGAVRVALGDERGKGVAQFLGDPVDPGRRGGAELAVQLNMANRTHA